MSKTNTTKKQTLPFTQIVNAVLEDKRISLKAKGLYAFMFSKPDNWTFHTKGLKSLLKESDEAISSGLTELVNAGWVTRKRKRDIGKFAGYEYFFNTELTYENELSTVRGFSGTVKPLTVSPSRKTTQYSNTIKSNIEREGLFFDLNKKAINQYIDEVISSSTGIRNKSAYKKSVVSKFIKEDAATIVEFEKWLPQYQCKQLYSKYKSYQYTIQINNGIAIGKPTKICPDPDNERFILTIQDEATYKTTNIGFPTLKDLEQTLLVPDK